MMRNLFGYVVKSSLLTAATVSLTWLAQSQAAQALSLSFTPAGSNLMDGDPIRDLRVDPGQDLLFKISLAVDQLADGDTLNEVSYIWGFDPKELIFQSFTPAAAGVSDCLSFAPSLACGAADTNYVNITGLNWGAGIYNVGTVAFKVTSNAAKLVSDGKPDFETLSQLAYSTLGEELSFGSSTSSGSWQQMEVQPKSIPTPALLPGLIAMGASVRRKHKKSKRQIASV